MKFSVSLSLLWLSVLVCQAQSSERDLFARQIDTVDHLLKQDQMEQVLAKSQALLATARSRGWKKEEAMALGWYGAGQRQAGRNEEAVHVLQESVRLARQSGDSLITALNLTQLGNTYMNQGRWSASLTCHLQAIRIREDPRWKEEPMRLSNSYTFLGILYRNMGDMSSGEAYFHKSLNIKESIRDTGGVATLFGHLGILRLREKQYESALDYFQKSHDLRVQLGGRSGMASSHQLLAQAFTEMGRYAEAEGHLRQSAHLFQQNRAQRRVAAVLLDLGRLYLRWGKPELAAEHLKTCLADAQGLQVYNTQADAALLLAEHFEKKGQATEALRYQKAYIVAKDSLADEATEARLAEMRTRFETEKKEQEIEALNQLSRQRAREINFLLLGIGLLALLTLAVFYFNVLRRRAFAQLEAKNQEAEQLLRELKNTQVQLVQSEKMASIGLLTAGVAHEINNPVSFIAASAQALRLDFQDLEPVLGLLEQWRKADPDQRPGLIAPLQAAIEQADLPYLQSEMGQLLASIENGAGRTAEIVQNLRSFSRQEKDQWAMADLHEGIESTLALLRNEYKNHCRIERDFGDLPRVHCLPGKLNQLFLNLLSNAVHAIRQVWPDPAEPPLGLIRIRTFLNGQRVCVEISDNGCGMDEATQQHIFEPFFTTKPAGQGTGLGLSISASIVREHKGDISLRSGVGEGTAFLVELPLG